MKRLLITILALLLPLAIAPQAPHAAAAEQQRLVVVNLAAVEIPQGKADLLTALMVADLLTTGRYDIPDQSEVQMLRVELGHSQALDSKCEHKQCLTTLGEAMGARLILAGEIGKMGNSHILTLHLYEVGGGASANHRTWRCTCSEDELMDRIAVYGREILGLDRAPRDASAPTPTAQAPRPPAPDAAPASPTTAPPPPPAAPSWKTWREPRTGIEFTQLPGGEYLQGAEDGDPDERPVHRVRISPFSIGRTEVTQAQWRLVMGDNPANFAGCDPCPVEKVSWGAAQEFLRRARALTGLEFRLPTEAEWEYAAGEKAAHRRWAGTDREPELGDYAWFSDNADGKTMPVAQKKANLYGLHDMSGNVWEWCQDWLDENYYAIAPVDNPKGPAQGPFHVLRGGSWSDKPWNLRVANRFGGGPTVLANNIGFRIVLPGELPR